MKLKIQNTKKIIISALLFVAIFSIIAIINIIENNKCIVKAPISPNIERENKIIEEYNNLDFSKEEMLKYYKKGLDYCKTQNSKSNGEFAECRENHIKQNAPHLYQTYETLHSYCFFVLNSSIAEIDNCIIEQIDKD